MSESGKIQIPQEMIMAGFAELQECERQGNPPAYATFLRGALRWLCPQIEALKGEEPEGNAALDDVLKLFAAPEPEIPPEIEDLLWQDDGGRSSLKGGIIGHNEAIIEAFNRGRRHKEQP